MTAVYVPPHADTNKAMDELYGVIDRTETSRPEAAFIVAGDFNSANLRKVLPRSHQHISCPTRGENTLDHVYTPYADTYKPLPCSPFSQSDHTSVLLLPSYRQKLKCDRPMTCEAFSRIALRYCPTAGMSFWTFGLKTPTVLSPISDSFRRSREHRRLLTLPGRAEVHADGAENVNKGGRGQTACSRTGFKNTDWNMFTHTDLDQYASSVLDHISTTIDSVTTQKQITMYPNQKPWMNRDVRLLLKARNTAFRERCWAGSVVHKAAGPDGIPGRVLRACSGELAEVLTDIFNLFLGSCCGTDLLQIHLHHTGTQELQTIKPQRLPPGSPHPHHHKVLRNRSTEDAVSIALHSVLSHLDNKNTYARLLFIDFSSAFNTIIPSKLITKLTDLGISSLMCNWLLDFLTSRPQHVRLDNHCSSTITINTWCTTRLCDESLPLLPPHPRLQTCRQLQHHH
ncbi:hypothetical protein L3Q82_021132 [Scortum barcoo]|uniref:Uncharacterized protein n=1 Tax=Scortum barcoo TaxID=214431 RepID=A0ACB8X3L2_9TELE|nr:hypothetical protein L3Q82_021132 [Scortum barcoo]